MDKIGYQIRNTIEEIWEEATRKKEEKHKKVQDQLVVLQHMLETMSITKECRDEEGKSMIPGKEADNAHPFLT